jgi:tetratricopeptide (TPR) repeat protein
MGCTQFNRDEVVERYLTGSLDPEQRESFEEHYFACDQCFAALQAQRALQAELSASAPQIREMSAPNPTRLQWKTALATAAVVILSVIGIRWSLRPNSSPTAPPVQTANSAPAGPTLAELARFVAPAYTPAVLRGTQSQSMREFQRAMTHYQQGDYTSTVAALRAVAKSNPKDPGALFFLGVSHLLTNQTDDGIAMLQRCIALSDTPYLEEAHYYLAKGYLAKGDAAVAQSELEKVARLKGDHEDEARRLLQQLAALARDSH